MKYIIAVVLSAALLLTLPKPQLHNQERVESVAQTSKVASVTADRQAVSAATPEKVAPVATPKTTAKPASAPVTPQPPVTHEVAKQPSAEQEAKAFIYFKESGNRPHAKNSIGCYGLGQDCNGIVERKCGADYSCQDRFFTDYMLRRYGTWQAAKSFWLARVPINGRDVGHWW